jgi:hypothetical protein
MWELSINKPHHAELELRHLRPVVNHLQCSNVEVSRMCAATVWGLAANEQSRALLLQLGVVEVLLSLARQSLTMPCIGDADMLPGDYVAGGKCSQTQRNQLQVWGSHAACRAVSWCSERAQIDECVDSCPYDLPAS